MSDKLKNLIIRALSGAVLLGIVLGASWLGPYGYGALLVAILVVGMWEFYNLATAKGWTPRRALGIAMGIVLFITGFIVFDGYASGARAMDLDMLLSGSLYLTIFIPIVFIVELFHTSESPMANIAMTLMGIFYVAFPLTLLLFVPVLIGDSVWQPMNFLCFLFIVWANDVFAYLVGVAFGRHRLCERLSPKKSWEGFFGGVLGALGMGALGAYILGGNLWVWLGLATIVSVTSVLGDLVESMFKREAGVKDSGRIMPGHGGMLDRFDAVLIATPFAFVYLSVIEIFGTI